jgi:hypothetical protein
MTVFVCVGVVTVVVFAGAVVVCVCVTVLAGVVAVLVVLAEVVEVEAARLTAPGPNRNKPVAAKQSKPCKARLPGPGLDLCGRSGGMSIDAIATSRARNDAGCPMAPSTQFYWYPIDGILSLSA